MRVTLLAVLTTFIALSDACSGVQDAAAAVKAAAVAVCAKEPAKRVDCYPPTPNFPSPTEELCLVQGCCRKSLDNGGVPCAFAAQDAPEHRVCAAVPRAARLACRNPRFASPTLLKSRSACESTGCCFENEQCFRPLVHGYELLTLHETSDGWKGTLAMRPGHTGPFANDLPLLQLRVIRASPRRVRIRVTDPSFPRYEVPGLPVQDSEHDGPEIVSDFQVHFTPWPFGVAVTRRNSDEVLFNSTPPLEDPDRAFSGLVFENQYLELSTQLHTVSVGEEPVLYGLGERVGPVRLRADKQGDHYPMFSRTTNGSAQPHTHAGGDNLYGVHPFVLQLEGGDIGQAHGILVLSSNAMEAVTQRDTLTFRLTGGVLDVFVFSGPTPQKLLQEYTRVVGRPAMPPYWALGYHVDQREEENATVRDATSIVSRLRVAGVPMEAYWQDANYMADHGRPLSLDDWRFPHDAMHAFVDDLHFHNQYFCVRPNASYQCVQRVDGWYQGWSCQVRGEEG